MSDPTPTPGNAAPAVDINQLLAYLAAQTKQQPSKPSQNTDNKINQLKAFVKAVEHAEHFEKGDIVKWKPNLKNKFWPQTNEPAIVIEVLDNPIINAPADPTALSYGEKLDIRLGIVDENGAILDFLFDSRRFEKYSPA